MTLIKAGETIPADLLRFVTDKGEVLLAKAASDIHVSINWADGTTEISRFDPSQDAIHLDCGGHHHAKLRAAPRRLHIIVGAER